MVPEGAAGSVAGCKSADILVFKLNRSGTVCPDGAAQPVFLHRRERTRAKSFGLVVDRLYGYPAVLVQISPFSVLIPEDGPNGVAVGRKIGKRGLQEGRNALNQ